MICLSLTASTLSHDLEILRRYAASVDMAELRMDLLTQNEQHEAPGFPARVERALGHAVPLIATVRRPADGGQFAGPEPERLSLLKRSIAGGFAYVDLESDLRGSSAGRNLASGAMTAGCRIIRSAHDVDGTPAGLGRLIRDLAAGEETAPAPASKGRRGATTGAGRREIAKIAVTPQSTTDVFRLLEAADATPEIEKILIGMGPFGTATRVLSRRFGSLLTFVSDPESVQAAPGHLGPEEMNALYRFREIDEETRFFAVIGSPIAHSSSPAYHNGRFAEDGLNACYVPFLVDDLDWFMHIAAALPLEAFSVTIPHKEGITRYLSEADGAVNAIGSCNTVVKTATGWRGVNTDVSGFTGPLVRALSVPADGAGATVIGAGGAARAIVHAILEIGMRVLVLNRTAARAEELASEFGHAGVVAGQLLPDTEMSGYRDLIVQTTSVGMHGVGDPVPWLEFTGSELVYDIVYTPPDTPLIMRARAAGCSTVTGDEMFEAQADAQYRLFTQLVSS